MPRERSWIAYFARQDGTEGSRLIAHDGCRMAVDPTTGAERKAGAAAIAAAGL